MAVVGARSEEPDPDDDHDYAVMDGWEPATIGDDGINMNLKMSDPLHVSQGDNPDIVYL